ncbi:MAG: hypothetical protein V3W44_02210 [Dehalococcoidales bacterium]
MSERKSIINIDMSPIASVIMLVLVAIGFAVYFLIRGLMNEAPVAYAIAGGLATLTLFLLGTVWLLAVQSVGRRHERGREQATQETFILNTKENLAIMQATAKVQGTQNQTLLRQARDTTKMLPGNDDVVVEADFLQIDDDIFAELE